MRRFVTIGAASLLVGWASGALAQVQASAPAPAASASAAVPPVAKADFLDPAMNLLKGMFELPEDGSLEPALHAAAMEMAAAHLERLPALLRQWLAEERAREAQPIPPGQQIRRFWVRVLNELALWRIDSPGPANDEAQLAMWRTSLSACAAFNRGTIFWQAMRSVQYMPAAHRDAALAGERELLRRWGTERKELAASPLPLAQQPLRDLLAQLRSGTGKADLALPPWAAADYLQDEPSPAFLATCTLQQWWQRLTLARGERTSAQALHAMRYTVLKPVSTWLENYLKTAPALSSAGYPAVAVWAEAEGVTAVEVTQDAQGAVKHAVLVSRRIKVPGLGGQPPIAFETLFDEMSLDRVRKVRLNPVPPERLKNGVATSVVELVWRLE